MNPVVKKDRRHQRLQRLVPDIVLPSKSAEVDDPAGADEHYEAATKVLIQRMRDKEKSIIYSFRNSLTMDFAGTPGA